MVWLVGALLLSWLAWGPAVLLVAAALLCVPRVRWWVEDRAHVERRVAGLAGAVVLALVALVLVVPDGWLPVPPAPGVLAGPSYVGRPATAHPAGPAPDAPANPHLAADDSTRPGPLGLQPEVDTSWFGLQRCGRLDATSAGTLVARCVDRSGPSLRLVDADTMRPVVSRDLPDAETCADADGLDTSYVDEADRVVVATRTREVRVVATRSAKGDPDLGTVTSWDLKPYVPYGDCLVAVAPDWSGRVWWASQQGLVGTIDPASGQVAVTDLGEDVRRGLATDDTGAYVVTDEALHRLVAGLGGGLQEVWRSEYDGASGSAPVLLDGGVVAVTDRVDARLGVLFLARDDGRHLCRQPVFEKDDGATDSPLAPLGTGVVVTNNDGYSSPRSTLLGFTSSPGMSRVDLVDGGCVVRWTSDAVSPGSGATPSWPNGLLYAWTKRPSLVGVSAWYLTAVDASSGRSMWSVRTGTGLLAGSDRSQVAVGADGTVWLGTLSGLVRVRDRTRS
ncbi:hypothetical protein ASG76_10965 [Nocardioides sp. Soil774]|uniref:hypothetical protein n=1 Tax=Nocardioides sp. Soil774 TaxID=1736408 RepID=UPI000701BFA2|nr:hypothetical protein [Nocardioides sp. Soil774]KRE93932.1 hypothetical protein ASG76_10965 [Nocardioides sp. Soil774]